jgi:hypothetical protein
MLWGGGKLADRRCQFPTTDRQTYAGSFLIFQESEGPAVVEVYTRKLFCNSDPSSRTTPHRVATPLSRRGLKKLSE